MDSEIPEKVLRYESFINDVLKEDLKKVNALHHFATNELSAYIQLKNTIETIIEPDQEGLKTKIDLGCGFFVQAEVEDTSKILVNIGLGHYVELTLPEAMKFVDRKVDYFTKQIEKLRQDSSTIKARIKLVLGGIQQLQNITVTSETRQIV